MGGLLRLLPFTYVAIFVGSLSLVGFPFTSGYYSKDFILELTLAKSVWYSFFTYVFAVLGSLLTACYSMKLIQLTFYHLPRNSLTVMKGVHEPSFLMVIPVYILYFCAIFFGFLFKDTFIGLGSNFWANPSMIDVKSSFVYDSEFLSVYYKLTPVTLSVFVACLYYINTLNFYYLQLPLYYYGFGWISSFLFVSKRWYFDSLFNVISVRLLYFFNEIVIFWFDRGLVTLLGLGGLVPFILKLKNKVILALHSGYIYDYLTFHFLSIIIFIFFLFYPFIFDIYLFSVEEIVILLIVSLFFLYDLPKNAKNEWF